MRCGEFYCCVGVVRGMLVSGRNVSDRWVYLGLRVVGVFFNIVFVFVKRRHAYLHGPG